MRLVGVAWDDGDHDEPQGADAFAVSIDVADGRLSVADATGLIGVSRRQIYRLLDAFRARGADGLISRKRWPSQQSSTGCGDSPDGAGDCARTLCGFWSRLWQRRSCRRFTAWISALRPGGNSSERPN